MTFRGGPLYFYCEAMSANPLHAMWSAAAPSWGEYADYVDERGARVGEAMLTVADVRPGEVILELGCGPGGVGLSAAALVGADGQVVFLPPGTFAPWHRFPSAVSR